MTLSMHTLAPPRHVDTQNRVRFGSGGSVIAETLEKPVVPNDGAAGNTGRLMLGRVRLAAPNAGSGTAEGREASTSSDSELELLPDDEGGSTGR